MKASRGEIVLLVAVAMLAGLLAGRALNPAGRPPPPAVPTAAAPALPAPAATHAVATNPDTACPAVAPANARRAELLLEIAELEAQLVQLRGRTDLVEGRPLAWPDDEVDQLDDIERIVQDRARAQGFQPLDLDCSEPPCIAQLAWGVGDDPADLDHDALDARVDALLASLVDDDLHGRFCASSMRVAHAQAEVAVSIAPGERHPGLAYEASQRLAWRCKELMGF